MEAYQQWMKDAEDYPLNLNTAEARLYNGDALKNDFDQRSGRLFSSSEARANLKVLENYRSDEGMESFSSFIICLKLIVSQNFTTTN